MVKRKAKVIPLLPLDPGTIFLPGVNHRISASDRPDIAALLSHTYGRVSPPVGSNLTSASPALTVGCIPLRSPYISKDGKKLITSDTAIGGDHNHDDDDDDNDARGILAEKKKLKRGRDGRTTEIEDVNKARAHDLYGYGVLAKVIGVQGSRHGEMILLVEGLSRFEVKEMVQERPYFRAKVVVYEDEGAYYDKFIYFPNCLCDLLLIVC